jgi:hypothetical protein
MGILGWVRVQWDRAAAIAAAVVGLLALLFGWIGVSGEPLVVKQVPYIVSGALLGVFMVGVAAVLWLSADLRDEWRELRGLRLELREQRAAMGHVTAGQRQQGAADSDADSAGARAALHA